MRWAHLIVSLIALCLFLSSTCATAPTARKQPDAVGTPQIAPVPEKDADTTSPAATTTVTETPKDETHDAPVIFQAAETPAETSEKKEPPPSASAAITLHEPSFSLAETEPSIPAENDVPPVLTLPEPDTAPLLAHLNPPPAAETAASPPPAPPTVAATAPAPAKEEAKAPPATPELRPSAPIVTPNPAPKKEPPPPPEEPPLPAEKPPLVPKPAAEKSADYRTINAVAGEKVEVPFALTNWTYLGEKDGKPGVNYDTRTTNTTGQTFVFRAEKPGDYLLKFFRQDFLNDNIVNDYVKLVVSAVVSAAVSATPAETPSEPSESLSAPSGTIASPSETIASPSESLSNPSGSPHEASAAPSTDYLAAAREAVTAKKYPDALAALDNYRKQFPAGSDEAWWLYGQCYEAAGTQRNIAQAVDAYRRVITDYPQSSRRAAAQNRLAFLQRFYYNIR